MSTINLMDQKKTAPDSAAAPGTIRSAGDQSGDCTDVQNEVILAPARSPFSLGRFLRSEYFLYIVSLVTFFGVWQWAAASNVLGHSSSLASPFQVVDSLVDLTENKLAGLSLLQHIWISTRRVIIGFVIAVCLGIPLGLLMAFNLTIRAIVKPLFDMFKPMPPLAWISIAILWFGIGEAPKIFIIVIGSFVPVVLNSYSSVQLIEPELFDVVRIMGGGRWNEIRYVCAPGALPAITAGLQIAMSSAWTCVVAAELVNSRSGLGYIIIQGMKFSDPGMIIGGMLIITAVSLVFTLGMDMLTRRLCPWQREIKDY